MFHFCVLVFDNRRNMEYCSGNYAHYEKGRAVSKSGIEIYNEYASRLTSLVVFLIVNILFCGIVGIAASIYDLVTRNYVIQNSYMLRNEE